MRFFTTLLALTTTLVGFTAAAPLACAAGSDGNYQQEAENYATAQQHASQPTGQSYVSVQVQLPVVQPSASAPTQPPAAGSSTLAPVQPQTTATTTDQYTAGAPTQSATESSQPTSTASVSGGGSNSGCIPHLTDSTGNTASCTPGGKMASTYTAIPGYGCGINWDEATTYPVAWYAAGGQQNSHCGKKIKITNKARPSKHIVGTIVDTCPTCSGVGGEGNQNGATVDLGLKGFQELFDTDTGVWDVTYDEPYE